MFGLAITLFFSVTGITLNHPDWFFGDSERSVRIEGRLNPEWLTPPAGEGSSAGGSESEIRSKLDVVEELRRAHRITGALAEFRVDERECVVAFKGPGYAADAFIDRESGQYTLTQTFHGLVGIVNDLHKGRDTGPVWSAVIDVSAVLLTFISFTGLVLLFYLKLRRSTGLIIALLGGAVAFLFYRFGVP
jgi:hypothetical protein